MLSHTVHSDESLIWGETCYTVTRLEPCHFRNLSDSNPPWLRSDVRNVLLISIGEVPDVRYVRSTIWFSLCKSHVDTRKLRLEKRIAILFQGQLPTRCLGCYCNTGVAEGHADDFTTSRDTLSFCFVVCCLIDCLHSIYACMWYYPLELQSITSTGPFNNAMTDMRTCPGFDALFYIPEVSPVCFYQVISTTVMTLIYSKNFLRNIRIRTSSSLKLSGTLPCGLAKPASTVPMIVQSQLHHSFRWTPFSILDTFTDELNILSIINISLSGFSLASGHRSLFDYFVNPAIIMSASDTVSYVWT